MNIICVIQGISQTGSEHNFPYCSCFFHTKVPCGPLEGAWLRHSVGIMLYKATSDMKWHHICTGKQRQCQWKEQLLHIYECSLLQIPISHVRESFTRAAHSSTNYTASTRLGIKKTVTWLCAGEQQWMCSTNLSSALSALTLEIAPPQSEGMVEKIWRKIWWHVRLSGWNNTAWKQWQPRSAPHPLNLWWKVLTATKC